MYLRTILELEEEGVPALRARIAERLQQSGPTVSQTVARMQRDDLLHVKSDRHLELTEEGRRQAVAVMRKHRLAELLLVNIIGMDYEYTHNEACKWEHVMSDTVEQKVYDLLKGPTHSPYGNVIPGLEALDPQAKPVTDESGEKPLSDIEDGANVRVTRLCESIQVEPELLARLRKAGTDPGAIVTVSKDGGDVSVKGTTEPLRLDESVAARIFAVAAD
ncbi:metal-dependent transcriptional regulator [Natronoglycomyces albus]